MLGHADIFDLYHYNLQIIKDNEALHGRCDSFMVKTNAYDLTDINLLLDVMQNHRADCMAL